MQKLRCDHLKLDLWQENKFAYTPLTIICCHDRPETAATNANCTNCQYMVLSIKGTATATTYRPENAQWSQDYLWNRKRNTDSTKITLCLNKSSWKNLKDFLKDYVLQFLRKLIIYAWFSLTVFWISIMTLSHCFFKVIIQKLSWVIVAIKWCISSA